MQPLPEIGVGMMGLGVVGSGVAELLLDRSDAISRKAGCQLSLKRVLVRDETKQRPYSVASQGLLTTNPEDILDDPQVRVVIELIGGEEPAWQLIRRSLELGKHVVTANKEVMAKYGPELLALAAERKVNLLFEASVGAGIPIVASLTKDLLANNFKAIHAIINGTTNYILTRMARDQMDFDQALAEAQARGYAEANPINDLNGSDAAYKLAILTTLAFHTRVRAEDVYREGITRLESQDFHYAEELGYGVKLLAIAQKNGNAIRARVHPAFVPLEHLLAKVDWAFNAIEVDGDLTGRVVFHGMGAGREPTASAVVGDLISICRMTASGTVIPHPAPLDNGLTIGDMASFTSRYYLRLNVADRPRVLAQITRVLGDLDISIASVLQKASDITNQTAEIVITTHPARESAIQQSLALLSELEVVYSVGNMVRVEEWPVSD